MRFSCIGTAIVLVSGAYFFTTQLNDVIIVQTLMIGVVIVPIIPVGINFSAELTFPIEPTVVTGTLMMVGQLVGFVLAILGGPLCSLSKSYALGLFAVCAIIASVCSIVIDEDLRRFNFANQKVQHQANDREEEVALFNSLDAFENKDESESLVE